MSNINDFIIEDGILQKYIGAGEDIVIPDGIKEIGEKAFIGCKELKSIVISEGTIKIGNWAFGDCHKLENIAFAESIIEIGDCAFLGCVCKKMFLPKRLMRIGASAFYGCRGLKKVTIPKNVSEIGPCAFAFCSNLREVTISEGITRLENGTFEFSNNLKKVTLPESLIYIGKRACSHCSNLEMLTVPNNVVIIGEEAFYCCEKLQNITLSEALEEIGTRAFSSCINLQSLTIPQNVKKIGEDAFDFLNSVTYIFGFSGIENLLSFKNISNTCKAIFINKESATKFLAYSAKKYSDNFSDYLIENNWNAYDMELLNNGPAYKYKASVRYLGALGRLNNPVNLTNECKELYLDLIKKNVRNLIRIAEETDCPEIIEMMIKHKIINETNQKSINKLLKESANEKISVFAN